MTARQLFVMLVATALGFARHVARPGQATEPTAARRLSRQEEPGSHPFSLTEPILKDKGIQGARLAQKENALTGNLFGQKYELTEVVVPEDGDVADAAHDLLASGEKFIVADLEANDLLAVADLPEAADAIIVNTRAEDDRLRNDDCRANLYHVVQLCDAGDGLAQYLAWKRWTRWFLISGKQDKDLQYAAAIRRAADRFGGRSSRSGPIARVSAPAASNRATSRCRRRCRC